MTRPVRLGLIGSQISHSFAPRFHIEAGALLGIEVKYDLIPMAPDQVAEVPSVIDDLRRSGLRGINVTYPFKTVALACADGASPDVKTLGAVNTLVFRRSEIRGFNTDFSGIVNRWPISGGGSPGSVALLGAGGVGRAAAFAFARLGADEIRVVDLDQTRASSLVETLKSRFPRVNARSIPNAEKAVADAHGVFNATPVGMYFMPGSPVDLDAIRDQRWVYDAIYAPVRTELITRAATMGIPTHTGFELFIGQGVDAFTHFTSKKLTEDVVSRIEAELRPLVEQLIDGG